MVVLILDFGSQYTHLISRRLRELKVQSEIHPPDWNEIKDRKFSALILSGSPKSTYFYSKDEIFTILENLKNLPTLGICFGLHLLVEFYGGGVERGERQEYGICEVNYFKDKLFEGVSSVVWMSHGDFVKTLPQDFKKIAKTKNCKFAAIKHLKKPIYAVQWHPEVKHTLCGKRMLENFLELSKVERDFRFEDLIQSKLEEIKSQVGNSKALVALSGGVDSTTAAILSLKALSERLYAIFVDTGLLREGERENIERIEKKFNLNLKILDERERFLKLLKGVREPEEKRRLIGEQFIKVFEREAEEISAEFLIQGTLYPDVIESGPQDADTIKSHHNVGGLPDEMKLKLIEPLREFYKDEVRTLGKLLGLPKSILIKHPFPGPGLAVRIVGEVTYEKLEILRKADSILTEELRSANLYEEFWQAFPVLLEGRVTGVKGDARKFGRVVGLRIVESEDGMTANFARLRWGLLERISTRITNEIEDVVSVCYFISHKPPQTIEVC